VGWQSYLRELVPKVAGATAGAAALAGGPIAAAAAGKTAEVITDDVLAQFLDAQSDQMADLVRLNREMADQLVGIQQGVDALLDGPWRTGLLHIADAASNPSRRQSGLELARVELFRAWGNANTPYRRQAIEQDLAALFGILNEPENARHWIKLAAASHAEVLRAAIEKMHGQLLESITKSSNERKNKPRPLLSVHVRTTRPETPDPLFLAASKADENFERGRSFDEETRFWYKDLSSRRCEIYGDSGGTIAALAELDAAGQLLRRTCVEAGVPDSALPSMSLADGAWRAIKCRSDYDYGKNVVLVVFGPSLAAMIGQPYLLKGPILDPLPSEYAVLDERTVEYYWEELFPQRDRFWQRL
jgi:hypothetical protein